MASNGGLSGFLKKEETRQLQSIYENWVKYLKSDIVAMKLYELNILNHFERENYDAQATASAKAAYLFHNVLMKSTYDDMSRIRRILIKSGDKGHLSLAKSMPRRNEKIDFEDFPRPYHQSSNMDEYGNEDCENEPYQCSEGDDLHENTNEEEMPSDDELNLEEPSSRISEPVAHNAGGRLKVRERKQKKQVNQVAKAAAKADYSKYTPLLPCYGTKGRGDPVLGSGLCVIILNFTEDLIGYKEDAIAIERFFADQLQYNVHKFEDLCESDFRSSLVETQRFLQSPYNTSIDRFFLFILSHGDEIGIKTCQPGSKRDEERSGNEPVRIPVDEVTKLFTHDKIPNLKGFPKCFFIQACQGSNVAQNAATADRSQMNILDEEALRWDPPKMDIAVGSDILVCLPSERGTYSWVPSTGSWFIQETIAIMKRYYKCEHLLDMMIGVNRAISQRTGKGREGNSREIIDVCQMPGLSCSLTKKFFLSIPDMPPYNVKENA